MTAYTDAKQVIESQTAIEIDGGVLLDFVTAKAIVEVYEKINNANKARLDAMTTTDAAVFVWKIIGRAKEKAARA